MFHAPLKALNPTLNPHVRYFDACHRLIHPFRWITRTSCQHPVQEVRMLGWRRLWGPAFAALVLVLIDPEAARAAEPGIPVPPNGLLSDQARGEVTAADRDFV